MKRTSKIAIISGIVAVVIIAAALTVHFRLSETEKSEIASGAEQNEKESASQVASEIANSLQNKPSSEQNKNVEQGETNEQNESTEQTTTTPTTPSQIDMSIKKSDQGYQWSGPNETNPTITLTVNMTSIIQFTNPTDTNHAFVIGSNGKVILESKDIVPGSSGKLKIKPTRTGVFEYHCKYHPETMKGILNVVP